MYGVFFLGFVQIWGCGSNGKDGDFVCTNSAEDGYRTVELNGVSREYLLDTPASYDSATAVPLVINFHGNGGCAGQFRSYEADLRSLADSQNFLLAYPQGVVRAKGAPEWDPGDDGSNNINTNDLVFLEQIIADVSSEFNVDASRIYTVGYSNGGMMAYGAACRRSNLVAASGIMSGIMLPGTCTSDQYTSIIHFHGTSDFALPYDGNQDYQSVAEVVDFWLQHNGIPADSLVTTNLNGGSVVKDEYTGGNEGTSVVLYTISNGDHIWFNESFDGTDSNQILWDFLSSYTLDGQ